jgi:hypothetical protein
MKLPEAFLSELEPILIKTVRQILDDSHGITEDAHGSLMELIFKINPESKSMNYLTNASNFKGRVFLEEDLAVE